MISNNKDNFLTAIARYRTSWALLFIIIMFVGFIWSRALLSISMMGLSAVAVLGNWTLHPLRNRYWVVGVVWFLLLLLTGFWSDSKEHWSILVQVKIPVLFLPAAFFMLPAFSVNEKKIFTLTLIILSCIGMGYTLYFWIFNTANWTEVYGQSQVLPTLADKDHIRFSMAMVLLMNWCVYFAWKYARATTKMICVAFSVLVIFFLHVLAVRTGLASLYFSLILWCVVWGYRLKWWKGLSMIFLLLLTVSLCFKYIPTLQSKIAYTQFTWEQYVGGNRSATYSDLGRLASLRAGWEIIQTHPFTGVGLGDVLAWSQQYYQKNIPGETSREMLPHNEFILQWAAGGLVVALVFLYWLLLPLTWVKRNKTGMLLVMTWGVLFFVCMIEPVLEVQIGVFVYLFFLLWTMKEVYDQKKEMIPKEN